jgi:hypothetical protein
MRYSSAQPLRVAGLEDSPSAVADGSGRDPLRVGLASEAALHEIAAWRRLGDGYENEVADTILAHAFWRRIASRGLVASAVWRSWPRPTS